MNKKRTVTDNGLVIADENGAVLLSITEQPDEDSIVVVLSGNITLDLSHEFEDELTSVCTVFSKIVLDFSEISSICSAGIKTLIQVQQSVDKVQNGYLRLRGLNTDIIGLLKENGFIDLFEIEK